MAAVLCNASPLLALGKLNRLHLLSGLFDQVQLPRAVTGTIRVVVGAFSVVKTRESWSDRAHEGKPGRPAWQRGPGYEGLWVALESSVRLTCAPTARELKRPLAATYGIVMIRRVYP